MYEIENVLRDYAWGSTTAIASLLGRPESGRPEAELWIGAHPDSPSVAHLPEDGSRSPLDALISSDPEHFLGAESVSAPGSRERFSVHRLRGVVEHVFSDRDANFLTVIRR